MKNNLSFLLIVSMLISLYGCNTIEVSAEYDKERNFAQIRSFDWLSRLEKEAEKQDMNNPFIKQRIKAAIEDKLAAEGIKRKDSGDVDVYIEFYGKIRKDTYVRTMRTATSISSGMSYGYSDFSYSRYPHNRYNYYGPVYQTTITYGPPEDVFKYISVGSLVIDMIDASSNELIWRSIAQAKIDRWDQKKRNKKAVKAVRKIMNHFPPK